MALDTFRLTLNRSVHQVEQALFPAAILSLVILLFFWGLGDNGLFSTNEARRAVTVREMLEAGQWLLPRMNDNLYLAKPPLFTWLAMVPASLLGGASEGATRLPSAVFALCSCIAVYLLGVRLGGRQTALYAVMILAANASFSLYARRAEIEMTLAGLSLLSLLSAWHYLFGGGSRRCVLLSFALIGLCLLTKGPVSFLFLIAPLLVFASFRQPRAAVFLRSVPGWLLVLVIGGSWYLAVSLTQDWGVWISIVQQDLLAKVSSQQRGETWYAYLLYLAGDFAPFWLVLLVRPRRLWQQIRARPELQLLAWSALLPLLVFSLFNDKHAKYLLPAYPAMALLLAVHWISVRDTLHGWRRDIMTWLPPMILIAFVGFYRFAEASVFAHRLQALPEIQRSMADYPGQPLYSFGAPDMRLVYYAGRPIATLNMEEVPSRAGQDALLFIREPLPGQLAWLSTCARARFAPYLKRHHSMLLVRLGPTCTDTRPAKADALTK